MQELLDQLDTDGSVIMPASDLAGIAEHLGDSMVEVSKVNEEEQEATATRKKRQARLQQVTRK